VTDPDISFGGPRGAEGAEKGGAWGGGIPLPTWGGVWGGGPSPEGLGEGAMPPPQKIFSIFY